MADTVRLADEIPIRFLVTDEGVARDISAASAMLILLTSPAGTQTQHTAGFVTDGTDGLIQYTTASTDLDQLGAWTVRARVTVGGLTTTSAADTLSVEGT